MAYKFKRHVPRVVTTGNMWPPSSASPAAQFREAVVGHVGDGMKRVDFSRRWRYFARQLTGDEHASLDAVYSAALEEFGTHEAAMSAAHMMRDADVTGDGS